MHMRFMKSCLYECVRRLFCVCVYTGTVHTHMYVYSYSYTESYFQMYVDMYRFEHIDIPIHIMLKYFALSRIYTCIIMRHAFFIYFDSYLFSMQTCSFIYIRFYVYIHICMGICISMYVCRYVCVCTYRHTFVFSIYTSDGQTGRVLDGMIN